jgi:apolipoprotein N-acyltransferase
LEDGACLGAGLSLPLAFAPFDLYLLAPLLVGVLFAGWQNAAPARAAWRGWLFGLGMFAVGVSWVQESFRFSHVSTSSALVLTTALVLFLACYPALLGYLSARLLRGPVWLRLGVFLPASWVLTEWLRGRLFTGFTWLQLGYSQSDSWLSGLAPVLGIYGVSWAVALSAGTLALVLTASKAVRAYSLAVLVVLWSTALGLGQISWTTPTDPVLRVALIQGNVPQDKKWLPEQRQPTLDRYLALTRQHWDADLIVWPETALPGYLHHFETYIRRLEQEARSHGADVLLGAPTLDGNTRRAYNSIVAVGSNPGLYHKRHLVPFGEYLPLEALLRGIVELFRFPLSSFSVGADEQPTMLAAGQRLGVSICYEAAFAREIRQALPEATLLVNISNDAWFGDSLAAHQNLQIARMRARETGRFLLRATNTGISAVIAPDARLVARSEQFQTTVTTAEVQPMSDSTPYVRFGDLPVLVGNLLLLGLALRVRNPRCLGKPYWRLV